ncbi:MAG: DUF488 domain-containing protein [Segniliparus sp.]|uniref:DUF488 domain-containing protein n=1 Tax=Segniliparus sp. TaxID=2804064 RepID=UPI003F33E685
MSDEQRLRLLRVYDDHSLRHGTAVLADRLWPRGVKKEQAGLARWAKAITPSNELRQWYHSNPGLFAEFDERYRAELAQPGQAAGLDEIRELLGAGPVTLLTAAKHIETSHLAVLKAVLTEGEAGNAANSPRGCG